MGCFSGCLMSSAGIQKLLCGIYLAFKCSFDEFVGEIVFSPSYSSAILVPPSVLIIYLFFLPVMLLSVLPRLTTDSAVRVFPGVWKLLSFQDSLPRMELCPSLFCLFFCLLYFFLSLLEDNGLLFWVPDVLCQNSDIVLWNLLSV